MRLVNYKLEPERSRDGSMRREAWFSPCRTYRYRLLRHWDDDLPRMHYIMLNPSTADAQKDDPTIRRCMGFARTLGFGSIHVVNLFAYRSKNPRSLRDTADPVGPANDKILSTLAVADGRGSMIVAAWGEPKWRFVCDRVDDMLDVLEGQWVYTLGETKHNQPRHPLYLPASPELKLWTIMHGGEG